MHRWHRTPTMTHITIMMKEAREAKSGHFLPGRETEVLFAMTAMTAFVVMKTKSRTASFAAASRSTKEDGQAIPVRETGEFIIDGPHRGRHRRGPQRPEPLVHDATPLWSEHIPQQTPASRYDTRPGQASAAGVRPAYWEAW